MSNESMPANRKDVILNKVKNLFLIEVFSRQQKCKNEVMYKELKAYQKAFELAMKIFEVTKRFPKEERYALIDQMRRSSRSVCSNIAEGYRKRLYLRHFVAKLSDADMENSETQVWLDFALSCKYMQETEHANLLKHSLEVGNLLGYMIRQPEKFRNQ